MENLKGGKLEKGGYLVPGQPRNREPGSGEWRGTVPPVECLIVTDRIIYSFAI